jgi:hypothetical protein
MLAAAARLGLLAHPMLFKVKFTGLAQTLGQL